ncbi:GNAT family N-acetyltransferase, partial [Enterococcus cecorum]|nr:GNAT family N-acetyltransferase [Enterococcus cecorum]
MIREVKRSEIDVLCELSRQTFIETFAAVNTPKDLQDYLQRNLTVEKLT